jgi:hypothetical protein
MSCFIRWIPGHPERRETNRMKWTEADTGIFTADELARLGESKSFASLDSHRNIDFARSKNVKNFDHITINAVDFLASCSSFSISSSKNNG